VRAAADTLEVPLETYSAAALAQVVDDLPSPSPVVQAAVGTPGVCEPAALLASGARDLLVPKVKTARATAAIARIPRAAGA
jgi:cobalamin biosynthesis protein CbiG